MKIEQKQWTQAGGWNAGSDSGIGGSAQLVLVFGDPGLLRQPELVKAVGRFYPAARIVGCSAAGEICGNRVTDDSLVVTAMEFEHTQFRSAEVSMSGTPSSFEAGELLAQALPPSVADPETGAVERLAHVFVLSDGLNVNGSDLVHGLVKHLPEAVPVTGGLAGDGARFGETLVFTNGSPEKGAVAVLGFYGERLKVGFASLGGWDSFGPERLITRAAGNVLYELDNQSALGLYKKYLGEHAKQLPASGLLFPLSIRAGDSKSAVVRTILSVDEEEQSMTFAGDIPEGAYARLMKTNFDRLITGAIGAATTSFEAVGSVSPDLAILISCVGRKLVLKQRIEEEVEGVREVLGEHTTLAGFYSYGEIAPFIPGAKCELHNQTMTITTFSEH